MEPRPSIAVFVDIAARDVSPRPERVGLAVIDALRLVVLIEELFFNRSARGENHPPRARDFIGFANQFASDQGSEGAAASGAQTPAHHAGPVRQQRPDFIRRRRDFFRLVQLHSLIVHGVRVSLASGASMISVLRAYPPQTKLEV